MAQTGKTAIKLYGTNTAAAVPLAANLANDAAGVEVAVNTTDKRLFVKDGGGTVVEVGINPTTITTTTINATGNVILGDASTDTVTVNGYMGVGGAPIAGVGIYARPTVSAIASVALSNKLFTAASSAITTANTVQVLNPTLGSGSSITDLVGVYIQEQNAGTTNKGLVSEVSSGINKWNIYASGTAANLMAGGLIQTGYNVPAAGTALVTGYSSGSSAALINAYNYTTPAWVDMKLGALNFVVSTSNTERLRLDSAGNLGLGVTPGAWDAAYKAFDIGAVGAVSSTATTMRLFQNSAVAGGAFVYKTTAAAGRYDMGAGAHTWYTASSGTAGNAITFTQVLAVEKDKSLALQGATPATGVGVSFPATQVASSDANTLDDYEEGTFTPTIEGTTTAGVGTYTTQGGRYTKIGDVVNFSIVLAWTAHTGTGNLRVAGLPFTASSSSTRQTAACHYNGLTVGAGKELGVLVINGNSRIDIWANDPSGGANAAIPMDTSVTYFAISGFYHV